jgi:hypothetical protein
MATRVIDPNIELNPKWIEEFQNLALLLRTKYVAHSGLLKRIYYHWSAAPRGVTFTDYNLMILTDSGNPRIAVTNDPRHNFPGAPLESMAMHTWRRNRGAVGICLDGMDLATSASFGPDPITEMGIIYLCGTGAAVAVAYGIDISQPVSNETPILTHAEAALLGDPYTGRNKYPGERWDFGVLQPQGTFTPGDRTHNGDVLRALTLRIKNALK